MRSMLKVAAENVNATLKFSLYPDPDIITSTVTTVFFPKKLHERYVLMLNMHKLLLKLISFEISAGRDTNRKNDLMIMIPRIFWVLAIQIFKLWPLMFLWNPKNTSKYSKYQLRMKTKVNQNTLFACIYNY